MHATSRPSPKLRRPDPALRGLVIAAFLAMATAPSASAEASAGSAAGPRIEGIELTVGARPAVSFRGIDLIDDEVRRAFETGTPAKIYFSVEVDRVRSLWLDESLFSARLIRRLRLDQATKQWLVRLEGRDGALVPVATFAEAVEVLGEMRVPLDGLSLPADERYEVRVRIECSSIDTTLPLGLHNVLPFLPGWGFDTGWVTRDVP